MDEPRSVAVYFENGEIMNLTMDELIELHFFDLYRNASIHEGKFYSCYCCSGFELITNSNLTVKLYDKTKNSRVINIDDRLKCGDISRFILGFKDDSTMLVLTPDNEKQQFNIDSTCSVLACNVSA